MCNTAGAVQFEFFEPTDGEKRGGYLLHALNMGTPPLAAKCCSLLPNRSRGRIGLSPTVPKLGDYYHATNARVWKFTYVNMQHFALKIGAPFLILFSALWPSLKARRQSESGCRNLLSFPTLVIDNSPRRP